MGYQAVFTGWQNITLEDLLVAYRKAKADCFFENTFPAAINFADYEQDLLSNLKKLLKYLHEGNGFSGNKKLLGDFRLLPKKLSIKPKKNLPANGHVHFSDPHRTVEHLLDHHLIIPEFRVVGDFPVDTHILSALWVNTVGHQFDAKLADSCYGARLRRIRNDELFSDFKDKPFHISAIGSFVPYFQPYQQWRNDGLKAIRGELEQDREIIAVSLDLKSFYHFIDPLALASPDLYEEFGLDFSNEERGFTADFAKFLNRWAEGAGKFSKKVTLGKSSIPGGLVIGLTASRIISNILLGRWDRLIKERVAPIHYGRYVDDMFLVLRDTNTIRNSQQLMQYLKDRMGQRLFLKLVRLMTKLGKFSRGKTFKVRHR